MERRPETPMVSAAVRKFGAAPELIDQFAMPFPTGLAGLARGAWLARRSVRNGVLAAVELLTLTMLVGWTAIGLVSFGNETHWTLKGLLTMLDEKWRGTLILGILLLFYRSLGDAMDRLKNLTVPFAEVTLEQPLTPGKTEVVPLPDEKPKP